MVGRLSENLRTYLKGFVIFQDKVLVVADKLSFECASAVLSNLFSFSNSLILVRI
jgi:hypothetical protein